MDSPPSQTVFVELAFSVPVSSDGEFEVLVANLSDLASEGFKADVIEESAHFSIWVPENRVEPVTDRLVQLMTIQPDRIASTRVPTDFQERWKSFHEPTRIGSLWIGPTWHLPPPDGAVPILIEPGQGFGTGSHPTTRLSIELLRNIPPGRLIDVGTGSGIIAIAAHRLGHKVIDAFDLDHAAVEDARRNIALNTEHFSPVPIRPRVANALNADLPEADITVANILLKPLLEFAPRVKSEHLILSGILKRQIPDLTAAFLDQGYHLREELITDGWAALRMQREALHIPEGNFL